MDFLCIGCKRYRLNIDRVIASDGTMLNCCIYCLKLED